MLTTCVVFCGGSLLNFAQRRTKNRKVVAQRDENDERNILLFYYYYMRDYNIQYCRIFNIETIYNSFCFSASTIYHLILRSDEILHIHSLILKYIQYDVHEIIRRGSEKLFTFVGTSSELLALDSNND